MKYVFGNRAISPEFRQALLTQLPGLGESQSYWRFMQFLLFSNYVDEDTGLTTLPRGLIAAIERRVADKHYSAMKFIDAFRVDVLDFEIMPHIWYGTTDNGRGKARSIKSIDIPEVVQALVRAECRHVTSDRVCMATGANWAWRHTKNLREAERAEAASRAATTEICAECRMALDYLNSLKPNRFTAAALRHVPTAIRMAEQTKNAEREMSILHGIQDKPVPVYVPSAKTARLYSLGPSFLHLHRSLRKVICQDWITADLRSAQLAIVARVWDVAFVSDYLESGVRIWDDLCNHMALEHSEDHKDVMKTALYALLFGSGVRTLQNHFRDTLGNGRRQHERFVTHPVIEALLQAREVQFERIVNDRGAVDACGRFLHLERKTKTGYEIGYDNRRGVLACVAQSYEMRLLLPVFRLAVEQRDQEHGFTVTSLLHDGFTFDSHKSGDSASWMKRLADAVQCQADYLGINTSLVFS